MTDTLLDGIPPVHVHQQHAINEIQSQIRHRVPVWGRIIKSAHCELLGEIIRIFSGIQLIGEGRKPTQANVQDDAT